MDMGDLVGRYCRELGDVRWEGNMAGLDDDGARRVKTL